MSTDPVSHTTGAEKTTGEGEGHGYNPPFVAQSEQDAKPILPLPETGQTTTNLLLAERAHAGTKLIGT